MIYTWHSSTARGCKPPQRTLSSKSMLFSSRITRHPCQAGRHINRRQDPKPYEACRKKNTPRQKTNPSRHLISEKVPNDNDQSKEQENPDYEQNAKLPVDHGDLHDGIRAGRTTQEELVSLYIRWQITVCSQQRMRMHTITGVKLCGPHCFGGTMLQTGVICHRLLWGNLELSNQQWKLFQETFIFLQVTMISDIITACGSYFTRAAREVKQSYPSVFKWPRQQHNITSAHK